MSPKFLFLCFITGLEGKDKVILNFILTHNTILCFNYKNYYYRASDNLTTQPVIKVK